VLIIFQEYFFKTTSAEELFCIAHGMKAVYIIISCCNYTTVSFNRSDYRLTSPLHLYVYFGFEAMCSLETVSILIQFLYRIAIYYN